MNKPVPRPRSGAGKPPSRPGLTPSKAPSSRPPSSVIKPRTPPEPVTSAEKEEHPSSKLRRSGPIKVERAAAAPEEKLDRSMRPAGMPLAAKFAIMIGVTVALTSIIMAWFIYRNVTGEVDKEINEAGVRTTKILSGIDASTVKAMGDNTLAPAVSQLTGKINEYYGYTLNMVNDLIKNAGANLPPQNKKEWDDKHAAMGDALRAVGTAASKVGGGSGGILTGQIESKDAPGVINVIFTDTAGKTLGMLDTKAGEVRLGKTIPVGVQKEVTIEEGTCSGVPAREYRTTWRDRDGNPIGTIRLFISIAKIEKVKDGLFSAMMIPLLISVALGIFIAVFIATRVTQPLQYLVSDINAVSRGDLDHQTVARSTDEIGVLARAFNRMTEGLKAAHAAEMDKKAQEHELTIAAEIQSNLLPKKIPKIPGYDISAYYRPSKEVGGDLYDFIQIDEENIAIVVADVSGKGVPGSMIMTMARSLLRMEGERNLSTADTLVKTNRILARDIRRGMFVTCMYMILNVRAKTLLVSSAGHNPLVVIRRKTGQTELINPNGIALGFDKGPIFERTVKEQSIQLYPGDRFCTYTDGVPEAMSPEDEEFGDDRFYNLVKDLAQVDSNQFVNRVVKELDEHKGDREQHDDITIVTAKLL